MSKSVIEALKEFVRVVLIAIIPVVVDGLTKGALDTRLVMVAGAIAFLRAVDKYLHKSGVAEKGLTRF